MSNNAISSFGWYAVRVRNKNEFNVSQLMSTRLGIETKVPALNTWKWLNGKRVVKRTPLLSTYVFMNMSLDSLNKNLFYSINGVFGLVRNNGLPAIIPEEDITSLEILGSSDKPVYHIDNLMFRANDRVVVIGGPLKGAVGCFVGAGKNVGNFVVCIDLFKRGLVTEIESNFVAPF